MAKEKPAQNVDQFIGCGCYQVLLFMLMQFINFVNAFNMTMMVFGKIEPQWTCSDWTLDENSTNLTSKEYCAMLNATNCKNMTISSDFYSVATQFKTVCTGMSSIFIAMSVQMFGVLVASPIAGQLSDWYGRKWMLLGSTALQIAVGTASAWSPNLIVFTVLRFFIGIFGGGSLTTSYVYFVEFLTSKHRFWLNGATSWSIPFAFMAVIAWQSKDWRTMTIIGNLVGVPGVIMLLFLTESPRWLLNKGKMMKAERSFNVVTKVNKIKHNDTTVTLESLIETVEKQQAKQENQKVYWFWDLFANKIIAKETAVLCFYHKSTVPIGKLLLGALDNLISFALSCVSYGIVYDSSSLVGSPYLNFFIYAIIRYFVSFLSILADTLIKPCGRKTILTVGFGIMFCSCVTIAVLKSQGLSKSVPVQVTAISAGVVTAPVWNALYMQSSELFPTPIRNVGIGFCAVFNRLGLVICPQLLYLAYLWPPATYVIFATLVGIGCTLNLLIIPETKGRGFLEQMPSKKSSEIKKRDKSNRSSTLRSDSFTMYQFEDQRNNQHERETLKTVQ